MSIQNPWELPINQLSMSNYGGFNVGQTFESPQQKMLRRANAVRGQTNIGGGELIVPDDFGAPRENRQAPITGGDQLAILKARRQSAPGLSQIMGAKTPSRGGALAKALAAGATAYMGRRTNEQDAQALKASIQAQRDQEEDLRASAEELEADRYLQEQIYQKNRNIREDESADVKDDYYSSAAEKNRATPPKTVEQIDYVVKGQVPGRVVTFTDGTSEWEPDYVDPEAETGSGGSGKDGDMNPDLSRLVQHIEPTYRAVEKGKVLFDVLKPYMVGGEKEGQDIPGVGMFEGSKGTVGNVLRASQGPEAQAIGNAIAAYRQEIIKATSGLAQTLPEIAQTLETLGQEMLVGEDVNLLALQQSFDIANKVLEGSQGMVTDNVMNAYRGRFEGDVPIDARVPYMNFTQRYDAWPADPNGNASLESLKEQRARLQAELDGEGQ